MITAWSYRAEDVDEQRLVAPRRSGHRPEHRHLDASAPLRPDDQVRGARQAVRGVETGQGREPQLRPGALVFTDNIFTFSADNQGQRDYMGDPRNGFRAIVLPLKDGMEVAVYTGP